MKETLKSNSKMLCWAAQNVKFYSRKLVVMLVEWQMKWLYKYSCRIVYLNSRATSPGHIYNFGLPALAIHQHHSFFSGVGCWMDVM